MNAWRSLRIENHLTISKRTEQAVCFAVTATVLLARLAVGKPSVQTSRADTVIFLESGRRWVAGEPTYRYLWDIKPPLIHELAAAIAVATGGDVHSMYFVAIFVSIVSLLVAVWFLSGFVRARTGRPYSGFLATGWLLLFPPVTALASHTFRPKLLMLAPIAYAFYASDQHKPFRSGLAAAVAAALWQVAGFVWIALFITSDNRRSFAAGGTVVSLLVLLPVVMSGSFRQMLAQTVLAPVKFGEGDAFQLVARVTRAVGMFGGDSPFFFWSILLIAAVAVYSSRYYPDTAVLMSGALVGIIGLDLDGPPDLMLFVLAASVSLAVAHARVSRAVNRGLKEDAAATVLSVVLITAVVFGYSLNGAGIPAENAELASKFVADSVEGCHVYPVGTELRWIQHTPANVSDNVCWPR